MAYYLEVINDFFTKRMSWRNVFVNCLTIPSDAVTIVNTAVFFNNDNTERPIDGMMLCMPKHMIKIQTLADFYFF